MKHTQRGSIVIFALIILAFVLTAALSVAAVSLINRRSANISVNSSVAFQNSDKGMEDFLQQLHKELAPDATLTDVAEQLTNGYTGETYQCLDDDRDNVAARIGEEGNNFIITAYKETLFAQEAGQSGWGTTDIGTDTERISEREELQPFSSCNTTLSEIDRFKVVGNQNNAMRAVFVKVGSRGNTGMVAHWDFEDLRTVNWQYDRGGTDSPGAYIAQDMAGNSPMEICRRKNNDIEISDRVSGSYSKLKTSDVCPQDNDNYVTSSFYESPGALHGAWTYEGVVREFHHEKGLTRPAIAAKFGALPAIQNYLVARVRNCTPCYADAPSKDCVVNCIPPGDDRLLLKDAITISAWVKWEGEDVGHNTEIQSVVSRWEPKDSGRGYRLYVDTIEPTGPKVCFQINTTKVCEAIEINDWHHVVGRWDRTGDNNFVSIIVDNEKEEGNVVDSSIAYARDGDDKNNIYIGAESNPDSYNGLGGKARHFFKGSIDDVRIWNRVISDTEVGMICKRAQCKGGMCTGDSQNILNTDIEGNTVSNDVTCLGT